MHRASLNHTFRLVWSDVENAFVAVAENVKGRGKSSRNGPALSAITLAAAGALLAGASSTLGAQTLPSGGQVVAGSASIATSGNTLTVTQTTDRMAADWQSFSIGQGNTVNFVQPSAASVALNRVLGSDVSVIQGALNANGQVFLVNPNGVLFSPTAQVNVGGLVASTLNLSTADFMAGKFTFEGSSSNAIVNQGRITAADGGGIALIAAKITNTGSLTANQGHVLLGAGARVTLDLGGPVKLQVEQGALDALIEQGGAVRADGGLVYLTAKAAGDLASSVINHTGITEAQSLSTTAQGQIVLESSHAIVHTGQLDVSGAVGGEITFKTRNLIDAGTTLANAQGQAGSIRIEATGRVLQTTAASLQANSGNGAGGNIRLQAGESAWLSGSLQATGHTGGDISLTAPELTLTETQLNASGSAAGGRIRVGGGWQGQDTDLARAQRTRVVAAKLDVSATHNGDGGTAVVWSDSETLFGGHVAATGGAQGGNGGQVEISSAATLSFGGLVDASAPNGSNGRLLLDPKNIEIVDSVSATGFSLLPLPDPTPFSGEQFGTGGRTIELRNNGVHTDRVVVVSPLDDVTATDAGAVYLYNSQTGALISTLTGSTANDQVGVTGVTALTNGNFLVRSNNWDNASATNAGAVTWGDGTTGISGVVSAANSLVGSTTNDSVGSGGVIALTNGNYLVRSSNWDNGGAADAGAVTWGDGTAGISGEVSAANSLVGSRASDQVGSTGVTALTNGNYVVSSQLWDNGGATNVGAVTWVNGSTGISGEVSAANSLVGSTANDSVGNGGATALTNGNYVVRSQLWDNGGVLNAGAVTWVNGSTGISGEVSAANSLVGSTAEDQVGSAGVTALTNGNYVVRSHIWDNGGTTNAGAVTWGDGTAGISGVVSAANSLVGSRAYDSVGSGGVTALTNGNYVVVTPEWYNSGTFATSAGAVTWGHGSTGSSGVVSAANSLVGSFSNDRLGSNGVTALTNGNYVVVSFNWGDTNVGAVTWGNGSTGSSGVVSAANSLVGSSSNDNVGRQGVTALTNGNYVVSSSGWNNGGFADVGAVTWGDGSTGISGVVSAANSLVGSRASDQVGSTGITALTNGNYVVSSSGWDNGGFADAGAVTWSDGGTGISGVVSAANSLVGSSANNQVGSGGVTALTNGNYVVRSQLWDNGGFADVGAVTWVNGSTGISGEVSAANSLVGSRASDQVGSTGVTALTNGNYVVRSQLWDNGGVLNVGAVTWGDGLGGTVGAVSAANSLVGSTAEDQVGSGGVVSMADGRALVGSPNWDNGSAVNGGRVDILSAGASWPLSYSTSAGSNEFLSVSTLLATLNTGTAVTLQANNDITLSTALTVNAGGSGGALTLQAGRSIVLNANIDTDNGDLTLIANDRASSGVVDAHRDPGAANITQAAGTTINAGTGGVAMSLRNGAGNTNNTAGTVTLGSITAGSLTVDSSNLSGSFTANNKVYDGALTATVGANTLSGLAFAAGSNLSLSGITATFANANAGTGKVVTAAPLTLTGFNGGATGALNLNGVAWQPSSTADITARPITVTADAKTKIVGLADPTLTYIAETAVGNRGLVSGDSLNGGLSRVSGETVGTFAIEQGSLTNANNTNYLIDYVPADLTISGTPTSAPAPQAAITVAQVGGANAVAGDAGFGEGQTALRDFSTPTAQPSNLGGLIYVDVPAVPDTLNSGEPSAAQGTGSTAATPVAQTNTGGRDAFGFMRVFVVAGGINLSPSLAQSTSDDSTNKAK